MPEMNPHKLRSTLDDGAVVNERMDAIRLKHLLDPASLTSQEWMCLQMEQNGFGCGSCPPANRRA